MHRVLRPLAGAAALILGALAFPGCSLMAIVSGDLFAPTPPRVNTRWANQSRNVVSGATPEDTDDDCLCAEFGPPEDRDTDSLEDLDGEVEPGDVELRLGKGVFSLDDSVRIEGGSFLLEGKGPDRTRLVLEDDEIRSLELIRPEKVVLRGLTVAGYTGGGIFIEGCEQVEIDQVHFVGSRYGLALKSSTAQVGTSVFAGCQTGIGSRDTTLTLRETSFFDCWKALKGTNTAYDLESCAFLTNRDVLEATLDERSRVVSCLFAGEKQELAWKGRPRYAASNLAKVTDLGDRLGEGTNREILDEELFPKHMLLPPDFDTAGVHLSIERGKQRGEDDPSQEVDDIGRAEAEAYAEAAQRALLAEDLPSARGAARMALRYLAGKPIAEAPQVVIDVAELAD